MNRRTARRSLLPACFVFACCLLSALPVSAQNLGLEDTLKAIGSGGLGKAELRWDPFFTAGVFSAGGHYAAFTTGEQGETGPVLFDNREIYTLPLPYTLNGTLSFPQGFVTQVRNTFNQYNEDDKSRFRIAAIVVDPGHGGKDSGAIGDHIIDGIPYKSVEKDITLRVSRLLYDRLAAAFPDKRVLLTREGDTYPTLEDRVELANDIPLKDNEAIIYVSVHANAAFNRAVRGYEVWYLSPDYRRQVIDQSRYQDSKEVIPILNSMLEEEFTTESILLAQSILSSFGEILGNTMPSRGLKDQDWFVVRNARMPSVLVELGFVTNETDAKLMRDEAYLMKLSDALYKGIIDFIALFERSGGFTVQQ
jgi:N-acetylmuramoyl-L-alanine amidase